MNPTASPTSLSGSSDVSKPAKKSPIVIILVLFLITGLGFGGFFMLKNMGKNSVKNPTQANILAKDNKDNLAKSVIVQTPEEVILDIQNNILEKLFVQKQNQQDLVYSGVTKFSVSDITLPTPQKVNKIEYSFDSKNSKIKFDTQNQKFFIDGNLNTNFNINFSSGKNNFDVGTNAILDGKIWASSGQIYLSPRNLGFELKGFEKLVDIFMPENGSQTSLNIKTNFENYILGLKMVGAITNAVSKNLSGKVIYISSDDLNTLSNKNKNSDFTTVVSQDGSSEKVYNSETSLDIFGTKNFTGENYFKTLPLFVSEKTGSRYVLKPNPAFSGEKFSESVKKVFLDNFGSGMDMNPSMITSSIFGAALMPRLLGAQSDARDAARMAGANQLKAGLEVYYSDNGFYPNFETGIDAKDLDILIKEKIMSDIPKDPQTGKIWKYQSFNSGANYILLVGVENEKKSNLQSFGFSGKNIYLTKDYSSSEKEIDKKALQKAIDEFSKNVSQTSNSDYIGYFDFIDNQTYKFTPISNDLSGSYIIFSKKNILESKLQDKNDEGSIDIIFKDGKLDGKIQILKENSEPYEIFLKGNYDENTKNIQVSFDGKDIPQSYIKKFLLNSNFSQKDGKTNNITSLNIDSVFGKLNFDSNSSLSQGKDFDIQMPQKYDLKASELSGKLAKILMNDPQVVNIGLEFFTNQIAFGLQSKNSFSGSNFGNSQSDIILSGNIIDMAEFEKMEKDMKDNLSTQLQDNEELKNIGIDEQVLNKFISSSIIKISVIKAGLKLYFGEKGSYPESSLTKISSVNGLENYFKNLPNDIFYKSISKNGQKNACYMILASSKGGFSNTQTKGFNEFSKIETFEEYQKILNFDTKDGKYYITSCE